MRRTITAAVLALSTGLVGCASSTAGSGSGRRATGTPSPAATSSPVTSSAPVPTASLPTSLTVVPSTPRAAPAPKVCASGGCTKNTSADLGGGYTVTLYTAAASNGSSGSSVLELSLADAAVSWQVSADQVAGDLACSPTPKPNCVVVNGVGAHASVASGYLRILDGLVKYADVPSDTPSTDAIDLNGDGLIDVVTAMNTYQPSYATGTVYWQTFQSTGTSFESTGCTKALHTLPAEPTSPLTGTCPN